MFSPIRLLEEVNSERKYLASIEKAEEFFEKQKGAIQGIKDTNWYKEIRMYWIREWEAAIIRSNEMQSTNIADYKAIQATTNLCQKFINFLDTMSE